MHKMLSRTNPFDDDDNDTVIEGSWKGCRGFTPASFPELLSTWTKAGASPPFQNPPGKKINTKNKKMYSTNPFDDYDSETVIDGSREDRRGIAPASFPASLSSWTTADSSPPLHSPPGEVDYGVTWYNDCNTFFTTSTPKCCRNLIELIHRCSGSILTSGANGQKSNNKNKMPNTMNPFDDVDNETIIDDGVTWYHDCNTFFTTFTPKCWSNLIESIHRSSGNISMSGAPGRKENIKVKMQHTTNPFDDDDNDTVVDDSWE